MGCGRMARVHPVEVSAPCCPHDLHHVPRRGDGVDGRGGGVAARAVEEVEDHGAEADVTETPCWSSSMTRSSRTCRKVGKGR